MPEPGGVPTLLTARRADRTRALGRFFEECVHVSAGVPGTRTGRAGGRA